MKTIHFVAIGVIFLVVAVAVATVGWSAVRLRQNNSEPSASPSPTGALTTQPATSISATIPSTPSPVPTQTPIAVEPGTYQDISYGADPTQKFDIHIPDNAASQLPLIVFVHGGAWIAGDKSDVSPIASFLANQGFVVINMNYRLLPEFSYPAPLEDFQLVLRWVSQNNVKYHIDVSRIGMSGHSAGGHLTALYALTQDKNYIAGGNTLPKVYAVAPLAGGFTLEGINITSQRREDTIIEWLRTANPQSLGLPIDQVDSGDNATFLLLHGSKDVNSPPSQSALFYQELVAKGVPAEIKIYSGRTHLTLVSGIPSNDEVAQDLVAFFQEKLK